MPKQPAPQRPGEPPQPQPPGPDLPPVKEPSDEPDLDPIKPVQEPMRVFQVKAGASEICLPRSRAAS